MLIEFTREYIDKIFCNEDNQETKTAWDLLNNALNNMFYHHHIVYLDRKTIENLLKSDKIENRNKRVLMWAKNKTQDLYAIKQKTKLILQLSFNEKEENKNDNKVCCLSINSIEELQQSILISENTTDGIFYKNIAQWFIEDSICDISLENISSGGSNCNLIILEKSKERRFICCIFDTDKSYLTDKNGSTLKSALAGEKNRENKEYPFVLIPLEVREKENLLPFTLYCEESNVENKIKTLITLIYGEKNSDLFKFYDIKGGIKKKKIRQENEEPSEWLSFYSSFLRKCNDNNLVDLCPEDCGKQCPECEQKAILGIGDRLQNEVSNKFFSKYTKKSAIKTDFDKIFINQEYIIEMWEEIADELFSFGCCISRSNKFNC